MLEKKIYYICKHCEKKYWLVPMPGSTGTVEAIHPCTNPRCGGSVEFRMENVYESSLSEASNE
jgi:hypothetical protein